MLANVKWDESVACFLLINKIDVLPHLSVRSCLENTSLQIVVGYINESDLADLPISDRIRKVRLSTEILEKPLDLGQYFDFSNPSFFQLVVLKWELFDLLFKEGVQHLIYSDLDVLWFDGLQNDLVSFHKTRSNVKFLIQSATQEVAFPRLCMGLVSMVRSEEVSQLIQNCRKNHVEGLRKNPFLGDDDVVSNYYVQTGYPNWILELPQSTFPVGNLANLFLKFDFFPGLKPPKPRMFHANYVVGNRNKVLLASKVLSNQSTYRFANHFKAVIVLKRSRLYIGRTLRFLRVI